MDHSRGLRCGIATAEGPCADLLLARREVGLKIEQRVGLANQFRNASLLQAQVFEEHGPFFVGFQFSDVCFDGSADHHDGSAFSLCRLSNLFDVSISADH